MNKKKEKNFENFVEKSVTPDPSRTYDGQSLTVMQGVMGKNMTRRMIEAQVFGKL